MKVEFDVRGDTLFNYGYGCCVFTHNYAGASLRSRMEWRILQLTPEFFANPRCPPSTSSAAPTPNLAVVSKEERPMGLSASSDGGFKDAAAN